MNAKCPNDVPVYHDEPGRRVLDLRPDGIACIPVLGLSNFLSVRNGTEYHVHEGCMEISLCLRGNLVFESDGREWSFLPGKVFVSGPREPHRMRSNPKGLKLMRILFAIPRRGKTILGLPQKESRWLVGRITHFPVRLFPATDRVKCAFEHMFLAYDSPKQRNTPERRLTMRAATLELLMSLVEAPLAVTEAKNRVSPKVRALAERVRERPDAEWSIADMAREAALSPVALTSAFKLATGLPPHAYVLDCRMRMAQRLLAETDSTAGFIAARLGFSSARHFAATFNRVFGCTPTAWRQTAKGTARR